MAGAVHLRLHLRSTVRPPQSTRTAGRGRFRPKLLVSWEEGPRAVVGHRRYLRSILYTHEAPRAVAGQILRRNVDLLKLLPAADSRTKATKSIYVCIHAKGDQTATVPTQHAQSGQ
jgi:hypothetical protein